MKDHVTALMEALRLAKVEIHNWRQGKQDAETAVEAIDAIRQESHVARAVKGLSPSLQSLLSPPIQPAASNDKVKARHRL
jgi:hypothetical protein